MLFFNKKLPKLGYKFYIFNYDRRSFFKYNRKNIRGRFFSYNVYFIKKKHFRVNQCLKKTYF